MKPYFSVCIPNYNNEKFIGKTLESVLSQSYPNFEIIVADNASTDKSIKIIRRYMGKDPKKRIKLIQNPKNLGYTANCNVAVRNSTGTHFILIGGDDIMYPRTLEQYHAIIRQFSKNSKNLFISGACYYIDVTDKKLYLRLVENFISKKEEKEFVLLDSEKLLRDVAENFSENHWGDYQTQCFSRELYDQLSGYNPSFNYNPEFEFIMRVLALNPIKIYIKKPLIGFRCHNYSARGILERANLLYLMDHYRIYMDNARIENYHLNRKKIERIFINKSCISPGILFLKNGKYFTALQYLASAFFFFPRIALINPKTYVLLFLLGLGPFGTIAIKALHFIYSKIKKKKT